MKHSTQLCWPHNILLYIRTRNNHYKSANRLAISNTMTYCILLAYPLFFTIVYFGLYTTSNMHVQHPLTSRGVTYVKQT